MAEPTNDLTSVKTYRANGSCKAVAATQKVFTIPAHSAGDFIDVYLPAHPIADSNGADIACLGNTSLALTSATGFTREVSINTKDADMANGDYWVNPITGHIHCKAATTSTTATADYYVFAAITTTTP